MIYRLLPRELFCGITFKLLKYRSTCRALDPIQVPLVPIPILVTKPIKSQNNCPGCKSVTALAVWSSKDLRSRCYMTHTWHGQIDRWTQPFIVTDISVIFSDISRIYSGPVIPLLLRDALSAVRWASPRYYHLHYNQYLLITFSPPRRLLWSQAWLIRADRKHKKCFIFTIRLLTCLSDAGSLNLLIFFTNTLYI